MDVSSNGWPFPAPTGRARIASDRWIAAGLLALLVVASAAMVALWKYKSTPGPIGETPARWPAASNLTRRADVPTLLMFVHPMCPCSTASLSNLRTLMSGLEGRVDAKVLFALPEGVGAEWSHSDNWGSAQAIAGVQTVADAAERETQRFGALTSGQTVLYAADGRLLFSGGLTDARGHVGENPGLEQIGALLRGETDKVGGSPVFGCELAEPQVARRKQP